MQVKFKKAYYEEKTIEMNSKIFVTDMPFKSIEDLEAEKLKDLELRKCSDEALGSLEYYHYSFYLLEIWESYPGNLLLSTKMKLVINLNGLEDNLSFGDIEISSGSFELDEVLNKIENGHFRYMQKEEFEEILKRNITQINSLLIEKDPLKQ